MDKKMEYEMETGIYRGTLLGVPKIRVVILGSILGSPYLGKLPDLGSWTSSECPGVCCGTCGLVQGAAEARARKRQLHEGRQSH